MDTQHRTRLYIAVTVVFGTAAFAIITMKQDISNRFNIDPFLISVIGLATGLYAIAPILILYLRGSISLPFIDRMLETRSAGQYSSSAPVDPRYLNKIEALASDLHELRQEVALGHKSGQALTENEKTTMLQALRDQFSEALVSELERRQSDALAEKSGLIPIRRTIELSIARLRDELSALGRRGNLNLVIGALTTIAAVGLLIYMVMGQNTPSSGVTDLLSYYIPRISTVIFIEIFGFFFLRLYKTSLNELKYYQNELTTLSLISIVVEIAARTPTPESFAVLSRSLLECDRNRHAIDGTTPDSGNAKVLDKVSTIIQDLAKLIPDAAR